MRPTARIVSRSAWCLVGEDGVAGAMMDVDEDLTYVDGTEG